MSTLLYGPNLVPSQAWVTRALLLAEDFATMTPEVSAWHTHSPDLMRYDDLGIWRPASVWDLPPEEMAALVDECISVIESRPWLREHARGDRVLAGKLPGLLQQHLESEGLLVPDSDAADKLRAPNDTLLPTLLAMCARSIAIHHSWSWDVATRANVERVLEADDVHDGVGVFVRLDHVPAAAPGVTVEDLLAFRRAHSDEWHRYLRTLAHLESAATHQGLADLETAAADFSAACRELSTAAEVANVPLRRRAACLVRAVVDDPSSVVESAAVAGAAGWTAVVAGNASGLIPLAVGVGVTGVRLRRRARGVAFLKHAFAEGLLQQRLVINRLTP
jgi:hypothetical protein